MGGRQAPREVQRERINRPLGVTHAYSVVTSSSASDVTKSFLKRHFPYGDQHVTDDIQATANATMRPIHDLVIATESTRMAQLSYILTRLGVPPRSIKYVTTDAFILELPAKRLAAAKAVGTLRFDQLHTLRRDHELTDTTQRFLNSHAEMTPLTSSDVVFRFSEIGRPLQGKYTKPSRCVPAPTALPPWRDLTAVEVLAALWRDESLLVVGAPGSGKSYWVRERVRALRASGKRVDIVAKTHAAAQSFGEGAQTADHYVRQRIRTGGTVQCDVLVCEEITQMEVQIWADCCKLALGDVAFILCGDVLQFSAIAEHWVGTR